MDNANAAEKDEEQEANTALAEALDKIKKHNFLISELKQQISAKNTKSPRTKCEEIELDEFKNKLNSEIQCILDMVTEIISLQENSQISLKVDLPTTLDEDNFKEFTIQGNVTVDNYNKSKELLESYNMQESLVADNVNLENDRYNLQEELLRRDYLIETLQQKIKVLKCDYAKIRRENNQIPVLFSGKKNEDIQLQSYKEGTELLEKKLNTLSMELQRLKIEIYAVQREREALEEHIRNSKSPIEDILSEKKNLESQLILLTDELNTIRTEKTKKIAHIKDKASRKMEILENHIKHLEKELLQCQAIVIDRENCINQMQAKLNTVLMKHKSK